MIRRADIAQLALELRRAGELLATPCPCGNTDQAWLKAHMLGEHIWDSTLAMRPGPKAQTFTPPTVTPSTGNDNDPPADPDKHATYLARLGVWGQVRDLLRFIEAHRPDQHLPTGPAFTDDEWCRNHLDTLGTCEPRYRGDTCRRCYGVKLTTGHLPPRTILQAWRDGARVTDATLAAAIRDANPKARRRKKRKAG